MKDFFPESYFDSKAADSTNETKKASQEQVQVFNYQESDCLIRLTALADEVEARGIDLTSDYGRWRDVGFALKDALGEGGRELYHRFSRQYPNYSYEECDRQYSSLLRSKGSGITASTLFYLAKEAGIDVAKLSKTSDTCAKCACAPSDSHTSINNNIKYNIVDIKKINDTGQKNTIVQKEDAHAQNAHEDNLTYDGLSKFKATFSDKIPVEDWPKSLRAIATCVNGAGHRDKMLLASLTIISGLTKQIYGKYKRQKFYSNILTLQFAPPAVARKSEVKETFHLTDKIDEEQIIEAERAKELYAKELDDWVQEGKTVKSRAKRNLKPKEPPYVKYDIAAKSTSASLYKQLQANDGVGYLRTTEGEVLVKEMTSNISDFTELLLYAFQNEPAKKSIATDNTHIRIDKVKLAGLITMPPEATETLIRNTIRKGLLSRFIVQQLPTSELKFENPFEDSEEVLLEDVFREIGDTMVYGLYCEMKRLGDREIQFTMTDDQQKDFYKTFNEEFCENTALFGISFSEFQFRLGLICFKLAMVLSAIHRYDEATDKSVLWDDDDQLLMCTDKVYNIAKTITLTMTRHTLRCYELEGRKNMASNLMEEYKLNAQTTKLHQEMQAEFTNDDVREWCENNHINYNTARRWLTYMTDNQILERIGIGRYRKCQGLQS